MSDIAPIAASAVDRTETLAHVRPPDRGESSAPIRSVDRVELSEMAQFLSRLNNLPIRSELIDRVRREIAEGTYETEERLDAAILALQDDLDPLV